jgi:hypothetical protein
MLSRFDDYPIHQTPEPIAQPASSNRNVYDRYWFNGYAEDGEFYFGIGAAVYPNLGIMDCGFSIVRDGEQHAFHGSRRMPLEPSQVEVGPFRIDILEPMKRLRVVLDENETGIACDLEWIPRTANVEEGRQTLKRGRATMDATRFNQFGRWSGTIRYGGRTLAIDPARCFGTKDRSWGIRPVGAADPGGAPPTSPPQILHPPWLERREPRATRGAANPVQDDQVKLLPRRQAHTAGLLPAYTPGRSGRNQTR